MPTIIRETHWNTGRKYTAAGQRIIARMFDDGVVVYVDCDRDLDGFFKPHPSAFWHYDRAGRDRVLRQEVMRYYDSPTHDESWAKGDEFFRIYELIRELRSDAGEILNPIHEEVS